MKTLPSEPIIVTDNAKAQRILLLAGMLTPDFKPQPPSNKTICVFVFQQHWCLGVYEEGHPDPIDNGFLVIMVPQAEWDKAAASRFFAELSAETSLTLPGPFFESADISHN